LIFQGAQLANTNFEEIGLINTAVEEGVTNNFYEIMETEYNVAVEEITKSYNEAMGIENIVDVEEIIIIIIIMNKLRRLKIT